MNFGQPVGGSFENADALAAEVDRQIFSHYQLFPTNIIAWQMQGNTDVLDKLEELSSSGQTKIGPTLKPLLSHILAKYLQIIVR